jgi:hypothetical protein
LFREGLALLLEWRTGLECVHTGSLAEAQRILEDIKGTVLVAIVDLELPDGAAIELLEGLGGLPVLALTSGRTPQQRRHRARALEAGVEKVLSTGSPVEEIVGSVQRLIGATSRNPARQRGGSLPALGGTTRYRHRPVDGERDVERIRLEAAQRSKSPARWPSRSEGLEPRPAPESVDTEHISGELTPPDTLPVSPASRSPGQ